MSAADRTYDVIVVGGGGAGAVLAARLSEDPARSVLLIEAGPAPTTKEQFPAELLDASLQASSLPGHPNNWSYTANLTRDITYSVARGKVLGGSTALNGTLFVRPRESDFARWEQFATDEWSYDHCLPAMKRAESDRTGGDLAWHGSAGPLEIEVAREPQAVTKAFFAACAEMGFSPEADKNAPGPIGYGLVPSNARRGVRVNTGLAYVLPVLDRPNLTVLGECFARRVVFDRRRAIGVEVEQGQVPAVLHADEVILCAGAINTPHLLMLSGIGPRSLLEAAGIPVLHDAAGVGQNFTDHPDVMVAYVPTRRLRGNRPQLFLESALSLNSTTSVRDGDLEILPSLMTLSEAMLGSRKGVGLGVVLRRPVQTIRAMSGVSLAHAFRQARTRNALALFVALQNVTSKGTMTLASSDPHTPPIINFDYLANAEDTARLREGVRLAVSLLSTDAFGGLVRRVVGPPPKTLRDNAALDEWIAGHLLSAFHMCGSARMGAADDALAVVDPRGLVHGVDRLRVADLSILPDVPSRPPAAAAILIGERVAEFLQR